MSLGELGEKISEFQAIYPLRNKTQKGEKAQEQISCHPQELWKVTGFSSNYTFQKRGKG